MFSSARPAFRTLLDADPRESQQEGFRALPHRRGPHRNDDRVLPDGGTGLDGSAGTTRDGNVRLFQSPPPDVSGACFLRKGLSSPAPEQPRSSEPAPHSLCDATLRGPRLIEEIREHARGTRSVELFQASLHVHFGGRTYRNDRGGGQVVGSVTSYTHLYHQQRPGDLRSRGKGRGR